MNKILVVDDEPSARRVIRATLTSSGYEVTEAANGDEGYRKAVEEKPKLIITDARMPIKDGYELVRDLRNNSATVSVPIIMLTGLSEEHDELKAFQEGVDEYVVKPVRTRALLARVDYLLARARGLRGEVATSESSSLETRAVLGHLTSGYSQLDVALGGGFPQGANVLLVGDTGSGKSYLCRRILANGLRNLRPSMMISLDDDPAMIRQGLNVFLPDSTSKYEEDGKFRLVDGYNWSRGTTGSKERFAVSGVLELNQLAGLISDAGRELGQSLDSKAGGLRVFDSISSLFINFELALVQRFVAQLARTATSYGGVTTVFIVEGGAVDERILSNIKYIMDGLLETKVEGGSYYTRVANMKWSKFVPGWIELKG